MTVTRSETQAQKFTREAPATLTEEIERALEMMRRVRTAHLAQGKGEVVYPPGNKYVLPKPLVYPASRSIGGECGNTYMLPEKIMYPAG
jgi:hypothetical protein